MCAKNSGSGLRAFASNDVPEVVEVGQHVGELPAVLLEVRPGGVAGEHEAVVRLEPRDEVAHLEVAPEDGHERGDELLVGAVEPGVRLGLADVLGGVDAPRS
jgi:hypothetical protein